MRIVYLVRRLLRWIRLRRQMISTVRRLFCGLIGGIGGRFETWFGSVFHVVLRVLASLVAVMLREVAQGSGEFASCDPLLHAF